MWLGCEAFKKDIQLWLKNFVILFKKVYISTLKYKADLKCLYALLCVLQ